MKITHLSVVRKLSSGQLQQLRSEVASAKKLNGVEWKTLAYQDSPSADEFVRRTPLLFRFVFLRNFWGWLVALKEARSVDVLMMRHMTFDIFALIFSGIIRNRASVHHAKEVEELPLIKAGWKGRAASRLEMVTGRAAVRNSTVVFGVTKEIADYQARLHGQFKKTGVYPNGIEPGMIPLLDDSRVPGTIHVAFICGKFSEWHGLDKLVDAVDEYVELPGDPLITIHLIGNLSEVLRQSVDRSKKTTSVFRSHGTLDSVQYRQILEACDVGIASLAMERQNLTEGSTLKVREMLALGLPVYSGHNDVALNPSHGFVKVCARPTIREIIDFGLQNKITPRRQVREESLDSIDKVKAMEAVVKELLGIRGYQ